MPPNTSTEIASLTELLQVLRDENVADERHAHKRFWFRGQSVSGWLLEPGVYRKTFKATDEVDRLKTEQHLTQDFAVQSAELRAGRDDRAEIYFLQQHYRMPTRLLDWTISPLAALHFAVAAKSDPETDAELFWMDSYQLAIAQKVKKETFRGIGTQRNSEFLKALKPIFEWGTLTGFPDYIMPIRPDYMDARINAQSSCFTYHVPNRKQLTLSENNTLRTLKIRAAAKPNLRRDLFLLGVDDFFIYRDLEGLASRLRAVHLQ